MSAERSKAWRCASTLMAFGFLCAAAIGMARAMQFLYATPTVTEYLAHAGPNAKFVPAGALTYEGVSLRCARYPTVFNASLDDYGAAYFGFVILNPYRFEKLPLTLKRYAYFHECGHQYVGYDEGEADCYAIRRGKQEGWLDSAGMEQICGFISRSKGDALHALGLRRCEMMRRCFAKNRPGREPL